MNGVELSSSAPWAILLLGFLSGILSLWIFRRTVDRAKLRMAVNRILAHLFELRFFADEPLLVIRSQRDLLVANLVFLRLTAVPSLLVVVPFVILIAGMEGFFARAPLPVGIPAIVTMQCRPTPGDSLPIMHMVAPAGIRIDTPPLRFSASSQIAWRLVPLRSTSGQLQILWNDQLIQKTITAGSGPSWISALRAGSFLPFLRHPFERPFVSSLATTVSITYPPATVWHASWLTWFSLASLSGAVLAAFAVRYQTMRLFRS